MTEPPAVQDAYEELGYSRQRASSPAPSRERPAGSEALASRLAEAEAMLAVKDRALQAAASLLERLGPGEAPCGEALADAVQKVRLGLEINALGERFDLAKARGGA